jgi:hypothetical protein
MANAGILHPIAWEKMVAEVGKELMLEDLPLWRLQL